MIIGAGVIGSAIAWRLARFIFERSSSIVENSEVKLRRSGRDACATVEADSAGDFFNLCIAGRTMYAEILPASCRKRPASMLNIAPEGTLYLALNDRRARKSWTVGGSGSGQAG
ncbi:MAG: hypothetical protein IPL01_21760 [Acidobacteria bacterium]|nr:hypothetical protein [Acidobacteriota bacterium]